MSKSGLKTEGHHAILSILEVYRSEILQKLNERDRFCLYSWFQFFDVSRAKFDLHNKYMI